MDEMCASIAVHTFHPSLRINNRKEMMRTSIKALTTLLVFFALVGVCVLAALTQASQSAKATLLMTCADDGSSKGCPPHVTFDAVTKVQNKAFFFTILAITVGILAIGSLGLLVAYTIEWIKKINQDVVDIKTTYSLLGGCVQRCIDMKFYYIMYCGTSWKERRGYRRMLEFEASHTRPR